MIGLVIAESRSIDGAHAGSRDYGMDLRNTQLIESVFVGGGETGARMRVVDWSTTALGPVEQWPHSLRTCVRVMLGSGYPMLVCWGPAYTMLYNDAYGPLIGTKHPAALGCSIREVLPETWDFLGPRFDKVMTHGQEASHLTGQMFTVFRHNYLEECYFSFSYSPIQGEHNGVRNNFLDGSETWWGRTWPGMVPDTFLRRHQLGDFHPFAANLGAAHCVKKYLGCG